MSFMDGFKKSQSAPPKKGLVVAIGAKPEDDEPDEDDAGASQPDDRGGAPDDDEDDAGGMSDGEKAATRAAFHALRAGDEAGFAMALHHLVQSCVDEAGSDEDEPEPGGAKPMAQSLMGMGR